MGWHSLPPGDRAALLLRHRTWGLEMSFTSPVRFSFSRDSHGSCGRRWGGDGIPRSLGTQGERAELSFEAAAPDKMCSPGMEASKSDPRCHLHLALQSLKCAAGQWPGRTPGHPPSLLPKGLVEPSYGHNPEYELWGPGRKCKGRLGTDFTAIWKDKSHPTKQVPQPTAVMSETE